MKSIVIFGGAGFVGKHLIRRLTKNGHKIIVPYQRSVQEAKIRLLGVTGQVIPFRYTSLPLEICTKHNLSLLGFNPIVSLSNAIILEASKLAGRSPL